MSRNKILKYASYLRITRVARNILVWIYYEAWCRVLLKLLLHKINIVISSCISRISKKYYFSMQ